MFYLLFWEITLSYFRFGFSYEEDISRTSEEVIILAFSIKHHLTLRTNNTAESSCFRDMKNQSNKKEEKFAVPVKMYRIGEVVRYSPFTRQTIHNYTTMGLIQESLWTEGGHRLYDETVFERLSEIMELRKTNTLAEIREIVRKKKYSRKGINGAIAS